MFSNLADLVWTWPQREEGDHVRGKERRSITVETSHRKGRERERELHRTQKDGREIECDTRGERRGVQLVAETERDVRI